MPFGCSKRLYATCPKCGKDECSMDDSGVVHGETDITCYEKGCGYTYTVRWKWDCNLTYFKKTYEEIS